jgi:alpha-tubulin suppressor-like RCC1 family protein
MTGPMSWHRTAGRLTLAAALAVPAAVAAGSGAGAAARAGDTAPAVRANPAIAAASASHGTLRGWGGGAKGQLGNGHRRTAQATPVRVRLPRGVRIKAVRADCDDAVALTTRGHVYAWGGNTSGQLGNGSTKSTDKPVRVKLPTGTKIKAIRAGCSFNLALTTKDHVLAWGDNASGQLGIGTKRSHDRPVRVKFHHGTKIKAISAGLGDGLAITTKGHLLSWGFNDDGELGIGTQTASLRPVRVGFPAGVKIKIVAAGQQHSLAVSTTGQLYGWGFNQDGELGNGTTMDTDTPVPVSLDGPLMPARPARAAGTPRIVSLAAGCFQSFALLSNGFLLSWGDNSAGELGDGMAAGSDVPVRVAVPPGNTVTAISAGCVNGLALTSKGHVLAWGDNTIGELGNTVPGQSNVPVRVHLASRLRATGIGGGPRSQTFFAIVHRK